MRFVTGQMHRLREYQRASAARLLAILSSGRNAVDLSDCGIGKTYVASYVAHKLKFPTLVVAPKISKTQWQDAAAHFEDRFSVVGYEALRTGRTFFGSWENNPPSGFKQETFFKCQSCQRVVDMDDYFPCYAHPKGFHCLETRKASWKYGRFTFHAGIKMMVFDELHRCGGFDSLNADMMIAARRQGVLSLGLSATAACSPMQMRAPGYLLGLHNLENFYSWTRKYGYGKIKGLAGWHWLAGEEKQANAMLKLRKDIIPSHGVRVAVSDVPGFPQRTITAELFDLDSGAGIDALYAEMREAIKVLDARSVNDVAADHPLTKLLRARQKIELLKVPAMTEAARDYVSKGCSVGIFVNFSQTIAELRARLNCNCVIDGTASGRGAREANIADFNADRARIMILNNEAGSAAVSLPDRHGNHPRVGLVSLPTSARTFRQLAGRFHREDSKTPCFYKVMLAANTVETKYHKQLNMKLQNLDALNDGDLTFNSDLTLAGE